MFESAELGQRVDNATFKRERAALREALLDAQFELSERAAFPVIILIGGVDGAGKGETVNLLNEWMDPRHIQTHAMGSPSDEERERPPMWRYWRALPPKGKIGIFFGSWYTLPILRRAYGETGDAELDASMQEVVRFERMLTVEGALVLKFWFHLSKAQQKARLKALERDPKTRWRVTETDWKHFKLYDVFRPVSERALRQTSTESAPWTIVTGADANHRSLTVATAVLQAIRRRLNEPPAATPAAAAPPPPAENRNLLPGLDHTLSLDPKEYRKDLEKYQGRLNLLSRRPEFRQRSLVVVFEGFDAAGKGGSIRRVTAALDARYYCLVPIAAPTEEERAQPYLWRFWRHLPGKGQVTIFDRSWYGRVLVERVEGLCSPADWRRAYGEINDLEDQLTRYGAVVVKFWLSIDKDEQMRRFQEREQTEFKRYKITAEDWRNREKWELYEQAVAEMVEQTSTKIAPWTLVEANDKRYARIKILRTLSQRVEAALR